MLRAFFLAGGSTLSIFVAFDAVAQEPVALPKITITGKSDRLCRPGWEPAAAGDRRAKCVGEGTSRGNLPGATIDRSQFERQPLGPRVQDIAKRLPGVVTGGGPGEDKDARVLGMDKGYTRTTVDGIQIPDGGEKREFNLDRLSSALVDSVDVIRSRRADVEADGIAGRVDIKLRDIPETVGWTVSGALGQSERAESQHWLSIVGGGMINPSFGIQGGAAISRQALSKKKEKYENGVLKETEDELKPVIARDFLLDVLWQNQNNAIRFKPMFLDLVEDKDKTKTKIRNGAPDGRETEVEKKTKSTAGGTLSWRHDFEGYGGANLEARFAYYRGTESKDKTKRVFRANGSEDAGKREIELEAKSDTIAQGEFAISIPVEHWGYSHELKFGSLLRYKDRTKDKGKFDRNGNRRPGEGKDVYALKEWTYAGFVQDRIRLNENLSVTPGVRIEGTHLAAQDFSGFSKSGSTFDILPSIPLSWDMSDRVTLNAGFARVLNRPKFDLLIPYEEERGDRFAMGNPDLNPEHGWAYDTEISYQGPHLGLSASVFYRYLSDIIEEANTGRVLNGKPVYRFENVGNGWTYGLTTTQKLALDFLDIPFIKGFSVSSSQNFARSRLTEKATGMVRPFNEQPSAWGDVTVEWASPSDRLVAALSVAYTDRVYKYEDGKTEYREPETSLDAQVRFRVNPNFEIFALGENLLGTKRVKIKNDGRKVEREVETGVRTFFVGARATF